MPALRQAVDDLWKTQGPGLPYMIQSADELRASVYKQEQQMTTMLTAGATAIARVVTREFVLPLSAALVVGVPIGLWLGQRYLAGFVDRVSLGSGIVVPTLVACVALLLVLAIAAWRHVRQALNLQPVEALR